MGIEMEVNVKSYGAVGDGSTDDTAAIQTAVNYCITNKKNLIFPDGTYMVKATGTDTTYPAGMRNGGIIIGGTIQMTLSPNATLKAITGNTSGSAVINI